MEPFGSIFPSFSALFYFLNADASIPSHLDGEGGDALWTVDAVPDAEVPVALGHDHVAAGHPLGEGAVAQQGGPRRGLDVVQVELRRKHLNRSFRHGAVRSTSS